MPSQYIHSRLLYTTILTPYSLPFLSFYRPIQPTFKFNHNYAIFVDTTIIIMLIQAQALWYGVAVWFKLLYGRLSHTYHNLKIYSYLLRKRSRPTLLISITVKSRNYLNLFSLSQELDHLHVCHHGTQATVVENNKYTRLCSLIVGTLVNV